VVAAGSCLSFALSYIQSVYAALEKASAFSLFSLLSNVGFLVLLALASLLSSSDVFQVSVLYLLAMVGANLWLIVRFVALHPEYRPRFASIDHSMRGRMLGFGIRLFVIQVAAMVIFTTSRLMASLFLGPASVVVYDAGFKIFSLVSVVHTLIMSTLWSSFTQAYERAEWDWIRSSLRRLTTLMLPLSIACVALAAVSPRLITMWLGPQQIGPPHLYFWFAAVTLLSCWSNIFAYFLNGIGNTSVQFVSAIVAAILNIPASYFFAVRLEQGVSGLLIGTLLSLALFSVAGPIQALGLLKKNTPR
jgi:O-antigen/teichoic acid export membrane protein